MLAKVSRGEKLQETRNEAMGDLGIEKPKTLYTCNFESNGEEERMTWTTLLSFVATNVHNDEPLEI